MRVRLSRQGAVSVVAPMFDEEGNVEPFVKEVERVLGEQQLSYELLLVDDGSQDRTWQRICDQAQRNPHVRGLSPAQLRPPERALRRPLARARAGHGSPAWTGTCSIRPR